jgi:hypothetical protein
MLNRKLKLWYIDAYKEKNIWHEPINHQYAIFPESFYKRAASMIKEQTYDFCFIGAFKVNQEEIAHRKWIIPFINKYFSVDSYLQFTDNETKRNYVAKGVFDYTLKKKGIIPRYLSDVEANKFDIDYYSIMTSSKFCLCPRGDLPWSMRFYEALMCKCIPIIADKSEAYRTIQESKLDYKFYLSTDKDFVYREDWVEHNYELFLKYHTLDHVIAKPQQKCHRYDCTYVVHSNPKNNGGLYCCQSCKTNNTHGNACEKILMPVSG